MVLFRPCDLVGYRRDGDRSRAGHYVLILHVVESYAAL